MKKFSVVLVLVLLLGLATAAAQDTGSFAKLADAFAPYLHMIEEAFKPLPACADLDNANLRVSNVSGAIRLGRCSAAKLPKMANTSLTPV